MGAIEGNAPVSDNDWESIKKGGDQAIERWIDGQLSGKSCTIVLVGQATAGRKWINYEIIESWNSCKGVFGVRIHNLKNRDGQKSLAGPNPFSGMSLENRQTPFSSVVRLYDPPFSESIQVYAHIKSHLEQWVEEAIRIRESYK